METRKILLFLMISSFILPTTSNIQINETVTVFTPPFLIEDLTLDKISNSTGDFVIVTVTVNEYFTVDKIRVYLIADNYYTIPFFGNMKNNGNTLWRGEFAISNDDPRYIFVSRFIYNMFGQTFYVNNNESFTSPILDLNTDYDNSGINQGNFQFESISAQNTSLYKNETLEVSGKIIGDYIPSIYGLRMFLLSNAPDISFAGGPYSTILNRTTGDFSLSFSVRSYSPDFMYVDRIEIEYYKIFELNTLTLYHELDFEEMNITILDGREFIPTPEIDSLVFGETLAENIHYWNIDLTLTNTTDIIYVFAEYGTTNSTFRNSMWLEFDGDSWIFNETIPSSWPVSLQLRTLTVKDDNYNEWVYTHEKDFNATFERTLYTYDAPDSDAPKIDNIILNSTSMNFLDSIEVQAFMSDKAEIYSYYPPFPMQYIEFAANNDIFSYYRQLEDPIIDNHEYIGMKNSFSLLDILIRSNWSEEVFISSFSVEDSLRNEAIRTNGSDFISPIISIQYPTSWYTEISEQTSTNDISNTGISSTLVITTTIISSQTSKYTSGFKILPSIFCFTFSIIILRKRKMQL
ncbi:MAG: hypothetical protein INQ03_17725 [Candidatus Heimdallarchaeota archaeon]|nr:hypothetical protein [Candidatus Heimdallarchaeota archaeon]